MNNLYLCCYDIQDDKKRAQVYREIKKHLSGGQYSAYECYLTGHQKQQLTIKLHDLLDNGDTLHFQPLPEPSKTICLGKATGVVNPDFLYIG